MNLFETVRDALRTKHYAYPRKKHTCIGYDIMCNFFGRSIRVKQVRME